MSNNNSVNRYGLVMGALLADAASLGLHWLYDPARIAEVVSKRKEAAFVPIDAKHFDGVPAYFAHGNRSNGMLSQYGECLRLAIDVMNENSNRFDVTAYQNEFADWFGMGGGYVGYIDRPTRGTVNNILAKKLEPSGIEDDQHPAITRLPAIVAGSKDFQAINELVGNAVQITNIGKPALDYARVVTQVLMQVVDGVAIKDALWEAATAAREVEIREKLLSALKTDNADSVAYGEITERACHLPQGVPLAFHILNHASDYRDAVNRNILAGGDSCGRAMIVGAVAGAASGESGLPQEWLAMLLDGPALTASAKALVKHA